jgi:hypothetical protein
LSLPAKEKLKTTIGDLNLKNGAFAPSLFLFYKGFSLKADGGI